MTEERDPLSANEGALPPPGRAPSLSWLRSPAGKAGTILALLLLMQLPLHLISSLIEERQARQEAVQAEFRNSWGPMQDLTGPTLAIPYATPDPDLAGGPLRHHGWLEIPAEQLTISAQLTPETRRRGLFEAVVYTAELDMGGTFKLPPTEAQDVSGARLLWNEAVLAVGASDLRGQPPGGTAQFDGTSAPLTLQPAAQGCGAVVLAPLQLSAAPAIGTTMPFHTKLVLRGTQSLLLSPSGHQIDVQLAGPWQSPSFSGTTLPLSSRVDSGGFQAQWQLAGDSLSATPRTVDSAQPLCSARKSGSGATTLGVDLLQPVPTYLMVSRVSKYGTLFLALSFLTYFLFETVSRIRIHVAQYALLGASVSLFALLLVALAEPMGFVAGYVLSTGAIIAQASLYTLSVVGAARLAALFAGLLGLLFGFLYVVLSVESFALLTGTLALFTGLSVVMIVTRQIEWSRTDLLRQNAP